jgi:hypothetical protein
MYHVLQEAVEKFFHDNPSSNWGIKAGSMSFHPLNFANWVTTIHSPESISSPIFSYARNIYIFLQELGINDAECTNHC